jgi:hypothetical protein
MHDDILTLTLAGGKPFVVRKLNIIAAHAPIEGETHTEGKAKVYLSSGVTIFVREPPDFVVQP